MTRGASWRMFNLRGVARFFVFDPSLPNVIYAQNDNLWRSRDNGKTWTLVSPPPSSIESISMASDHSDERVISNTSPLGSITALAIDPDNSSHLYAAATQLIPDYLNPLTTVHGGHAIPICLSLSATCGSARNPPNRCSESESIPSLKAGARNSIPHLQRLRYSPLPQVNPARVLGQSIRSVSPG